jgi:hypothetical protein
MSSQGNNELVAVGVALAIGLVAIYVNIQHYDHGTTTQVDVKADRSMSEKVELPLPPDLWPRQ